MHVPLILPLLLSQTEHLSRNSSLTNSCGRQPQPPPPRCPPHRLPRPLLFPDAANAGVMVRVRLSLALTAVFASRVFGACEQTFLLFPSRFRNAPLRLTRAPFHLVLGEFQETERGNERDSAALHPHGSTKTLLTHEWVLNIRKVQTLLPDAI